MSALWTDTITRLTPYVPGEQRSGVDIVKLNTNENPYPPSPNVLQAIASVSGDQLR
ncbi:MAG: histidinol-phosphate aminotransferase, partial [Flavobacteriaceae bacterium]